MLLILLGRQRLFNGVREEQVGDNHYHNELDRDATCQFIPKAVFVNVIFLLYCEDSWSCSFEIFLSTIKLTIKLNKIPTINKQMI